MKLRSQSKKHSGVGSSTSGDGTTRRIIYLGRENEVEGKGKGKGKGKSGKGKGKENPNPPTRVICLAFEEKCATGSAAPSRLRALERDDTIGDDVKEEQGDDADDDDGSETGTGDSTEEEDEDGLFPDTLSTSYGHSQRDSVEASTNITTPTPTPPSMSKHVTLPPVDEERECNCCAPNPLTVSSFQKSLEEAARDETLYFTEFYTFVHAMWTAKAKLPAADFGIFSLTLAAAYLRATDILETIHLVEGNDLTQEIKAAEEEDMYSTESVALHLADEFIKVRGLLKKDYMPWSRPSAADYMRVDDMWLDYYTNRFSEIVSSRSDRDESTDEEEEVKSSTPTGVPNAPKGTAKTSSLKRKASDIQPEGDSKVLKTRFLKARRTTRKSKETGPKRGGAAKVK